MRLPAKLDERGPAREIRRKLNQVIDALVSLRIIRAPNLRVSHTNLGQRLEVEPPSPGVAPEDQPSAMIFLGEWSAAATYKKNHVVVRRGGLTGGTYIAIADPPVGTAPEDGVNWVSLSKQSQLGIW